MARTDDLSDDLAALMDAVSLLTRAEIAAVAVQRPWQMCHHAIGRLEAEIAAYFAPPVAALDCRVTSLAFDGEPGGPDEDEPHPPGCACGFCLSG